MIEAAALYQAVRKFAVSTPSWALAIRYWTVPDERWDLTLACQRIYGNRTDFLVILAAAGLSRFDDPLTERLLVLPTASQLASIKQQVGWVDPPLPPVR